MRVVVYEELRERFGIRYSRAHLRKLEAAGRFPRRFRLADGGVCGWDDGELLAYLRARRDMRDAPAVAAVIDIEAPPPTKRPRGRPRIYPRPDEAEAPA